MSSGIVFKRLILKNFLSFGSKPTTIDLTGNHITVVLGLNHDTGGDESRNGVGKSSLIDGISYALFGKTIRGISNAKLVNKMMRKGQGMLVVLELDTHEGSYRIERGEAPGKLKLFRKELDDPEEFLKRDGKTFVYDISRNKGETTAEIEGLIGFDIKLFEFLIANSAESDAFMKLPEDKKREIAERLMGLNLLTERAEELKVERKDKKKDLIAEESAMEATKQANARVERQMEQIAAKEEAWEEQRKAEVDKLRKNIEKMAGIDLEEQTEILTLIDELEAEAARIKSDRREAMLELKNAKRDVSDLDRELDQKSKSQEKLTAKKTKILEGTCPTCEQSWVPDESVVEEIDKELLEIEGFMDDAQDIGRAAEGAVKEAQAVVDKLAEDEAELDKTTEEIGDFDLQFDDLTELAKVEQSIENDKAALEKAEKAVNPHSDTFAELAENAVKAIDPTGVQDLRSLIDHYNYLIDLLQSKDSFLRKAVIDRWLPKLNGRIAHYLETLELPYTVRIENDLTMSIRDFGEEFDWGNLSKGQRQRVSIALNLAFQDLFEATNQPLSLLMVDEMIDSGICNRGASQAVKALRDASQDKDKRVFLITHRLDIADQIEDVMLIELKNRISRIEEDGFEEA